MEGWALHLHLELGGLGGEVRDAPKLLAARQGELLALAEVDTSVPSPTETLGSLSNVPVTLPLLRTTTLPGPEAMNVESTSLRLMDFTVMLLVEGLG